MPSTRIAQVTSTIGSVTETLDVQRVRAGELVRKLREQRAVLGVRREAASQQFLRLQSQFDDAIAETTLPRPRATVRRTGGPVTPAVDFCDRDTWYDHVAFARRRDPAVLARLVARYQEDVDRQARRIGTRASYDDLLQVAREALVLALHRFDPTRRKPFPPFARLTVEGTLRRYLRDQGYTIRPSRRVYELTPRVRQVNDWLSQEFGRPPTPGEIADALGVPVADVREVRGSAATRTPLSLDRPLGEDGLTFADLAGEADPNLSRALDRRALAQVMQGLPEKDKDLLNRYFLENQTQQQIADELGVSQMHVSRSLARILRRLRARASTNPN